jgi:uncharacterized protein (TIGR03790 family)
MRSTLLGGCIAALAAAAFAGGGPLNTIVVVNDLSPDSLEIGLRYARARGIPESHICHVTTAPSGTLQITAWSNEIRNPVLSFIAEQGLSNQIDYVVFAHGLPYRVLNNLEVTPPPDITQLYASLTSCMYYDHFASSNAFLFGCHLNPFATNAYFGRDRAFRRMDSPNGRYLISALIIAHSPDQTRAVLRRAAQSDYTAPSGRIDLVRTSDGLRSVRWPMHEEADFRARLFGYRNQWALITSNTPPISTNRMGYQTGLAAVPDVFSHQYAKGAYADHLTSFGGILDIPTGQTIILDWLKAGAAGAYGTVAEPCAYIAKFPTPNIYHLYERGFTLGESLYMATAYPYQGLFVGDPLAAPYAVPSTVSFPHITSGAIVSGVATIDVSVVAADATRPVHRLDLFIDGRWSNTILQMAPSAGNVLHLSLPDGPAFYTVGPGDDLYACAAGLAAAVNATSALVFAEARGDTVHLTWSAFGQSASNQSIFAAALQGAATNLDLLAWTPTPTFVDSPYAAREILSLQGHAVSGDQAVAVITLTNGLVFTNIGHAESDMGAPQLLFRLQSAINSNISLQGADGVISEYLQQYTPALADLVLAARSPGFEGIGIHVDYRILTQPGSTLSTNEAFQDVFNDNASVMRPRAIVRLAEGRTNLNAAFEIDTTALPNGPARLDVVAFEGTAVRAQGRAARWVYVSNTPYRCEITAPPPFHHVLRGGVVTSVAIVAAGAGATTQVAFFVEGKYAGAATAPPYQWGWSTTNYAIGPVHVQAVAYNDAGESARSQMRPVVIYTDVDADGLSDQWEIDWFESATNATPTGDADGDGQNHLEEFIAGTDPTSSGSALAVTALIADPVEGLPRLTFGAVSTRAYRVEWADDSIGGPWFAATGSISGVEGAIDWLDAPSNAPPPSGILRAYRVRTSLP